MAESASPLKEHALELGFTTVGVCRAVPPPHLGAYREWLAKDFAGDMSYLRRHLPAKSDPQTLLPGVRSIVAVTLNYNQPNPARPGYPRIARYALGRDYHKVIRGKLKRLAAWIEAAHPDARCRPCVDSAPILEREYAQSAGLGWFGKNTMLIDSRRGSWFFIGLLLTTVAFEPDTPAVGGCGTCLKCIDACPTGALVFEENRWQLDARRCISYLTIEHRGEIEPDLSRKMGDWTFGCDVCQEVCPFNQPRISQPDRGTPTEVADFINVLSLPSLADLASLDESEWDGLANGSAVRRAGFKGLVRNARINLQNAPADSPPLTKGWTREELDDPKRIGLE